VIFSSTLFLFLFLPVLIALYFQAQRRYRNLILVVASLGFYAWGEPKFLRVVLTSVALNYFLGLIVGYYNEGWRAKVAIVSAVTLNIGLLGYYKYSDFAVANLNALLKIACHKQNALNVEHVALPLGISFFTFHALSYVLDIYRKHARAQKNPLLLTLNILFFPQLVAGPIVRYHEIADQLTQRYVTSADFASGIQRFILGLGKKILIANVLAEVANTAFGPSTTGITTQVAWLSTIAYALQIYFDFSGYSDMAIGLAQMFGFCFPENFNYPYVAQSLTEFWRRWHMTLSRWFRDYLYIPLGGNRVAPARLYTNLILVFFLCGLWHGASWNFVIWGLLHGAFLVVERMGFLKALDRMWSPLRHVYCLIVVLVAWVFFRAETFDGAQQVLRAMAGISHPNGAAISTSIYLNNEQVFALVAGIAASTPLLPWLALQRDRFNFPASGFVLQLGRIGALGLVLFTSVIRLSSGTYNPFIYFRF